MDICEEGQQSNCGRHIFREADLAYLLIDGEKMFPLAELLASLFSNTARTTLFTRMEKINTRRHFCTAEEIKLLKTVNGIHGSSAICTLIPEADVQKYCAVYIDRTVDIKLFSTSIRRTKTVNNVSKTKDNKQDKGGTENSNSTAKANEGKSTNSSNVESDKASKSLKEKKASTGKQKFDNKAKAEVPWVVKTTHKGNHSKLLDECSESEVNEHPNSLSALAEHVLNGTQTLHSRCGVKERKKRKAKDSLEDSFTKANYRQNKKAKRANEEESESIRCSPWRQCTTQRASNVIDNRSVLSDGCSSTEHPCGSSLSQCLTNANSEILFSDSSSNDSGFASTTIYAESLISNKPSTNSNHHSEEKRPNKTCILPSSTKQGKCKKLKKARLETKEDKPVNQSLSPPALVLKRQNNVWQVETKSEQEDDTDSFKTSTTTSKAKKRLKWSSSNNKKTKTQDVNTEKTIHRKKRRKHSFSDKEEASAIQVVGQGRNPKHNRKTIQKKLNQHVGSKVNVIDPNAKNNSSVKSSKVSNTIKRGKKPKQATNNLRNTKKVTVTKTLKANKDFKFMSLFSSFPFLSVKDGDLCPSFSEVLPTHSETDISSSNPIWKWQRGRPIFVPEKTKKTYVR